MITLKLIFGKRPCVRISKDRSETGDKNDQETQLYRNQSINRACSNNFMKLRKASVVFQTTDECAYIKIFYI